MQATVWPLNPLKGSIDYFALTCYGVVMILAATNLAQMLNRIDWDQAAEALARNAAVVVLVLLAGLLIYRLVSMTIRRTISLISKDTFLTAEQAKQRATTLGAVLDALARFVVFFLAILVILQSTEVVDVTAVIASAGVLGVAIGLAAQNIIRDFLTGFFILFENQYAVGDVVQIGSAKGTVESLSLRTTQLRDFQGKVHTIPNSQITVVINQSRGWSRAVVDFGVANRYNPEDILRTLKEEVSSLWRDEKLRPLLHEEPQVTGIEDFRESAVMFRVTALTDPSNQDQVARLLRQKVAARLVAEDIEMVCKPAQ